MPEIQPNPQKPVFDKWQFASIAFELGFIIALPLVALGLAGKWVDTKLGTQPWFVLIGILLAISSSTLWLTKRIRTMLK